MRSSCFYSSLSLLFLSVYLSIYVNIDIHRIYFYNAAEFPKYILSKDDAFSIYVRSKTLTNILYSPLFYVICCWHDMQMLKTCEGRYTSVIAKVISININAEQTTSFPYSAWNKGHVSLSIKLHWIMLYMIPFFFYSNW